MKTMSKLALCATAISLLIVNESWAQIGGGSIVGSVLDSSSGVISGAKVTAVNVATNVLSTTVICLILAWILALLFSVTFGGWIHLLPVAAAPLLLARIARTPPDVAEFAKWKLARARRLRR